MLPDPPAPIRTKTAAELGLNHNNFKPFALYASIVAAARTDRRKTLKPTNSLKERTARDSLLDRQNRSRKKQKHKEHQVFQLISRLRTMLATLASTAYMVGNYLSLVPIPHATTTTTINR